jgi:hypothetical protein
MSAQYDKSEDLVARLRANAQGLSLGAEGMGWSPEDLYRAAADEIERLRAVMKRANDRFNDAEAMEGIIIIAEEVGDE